MKQCKKDGCYNNCWGGGFCVNHQYLRIDKKTTKKMPFKAQKKPLQDFSFEFDSQVSLFDWCWQNALNKQGEVICPYTGEKLNRYLGTDMYYSCFAHILPKGRYTYFKYYPNNIRVVNPAFHAICDQGTRLDRINHLTWKFDKWDSEVEIMKREYELFKQINLLS